MRLIVASAILALGISGSAATAQPLRSQYAPAYVTETWIGNVIEARGAYYGGRKIAIDSALCLGLRRYGVRTSTYGLDKFWRFKCDLIGANNNLYTAQVSTTRGPRRGYIYWHFLSVRKDF